MHRFSHAIAADQALLVGGALILSGSLKLTPAGMDAGRATLLLRRLDGAPRLQTAAWVLLGAVEGLVGFADLLGLRLALAISAGLLAAACAYLALSRRRAPTAPCGCLGTLSSRPPSLPGQLRAGVLLCAAVAGASIAPGLTALHAPSGQPAALPVLAAEAFLVLALSRELALGAVLGTLGDRARCVLASARPPAAAQIAARARAAASWEAVRAYVTAEEPVEVWRSGCWMYATFPARLDDRALTAVVALSLGRGAALTSVALVDEATQAIVHQCVTHHAAAPAPGPAGRAAPAAVMP
jgi:hypothetical protein